jgi:hypothetical protein
MSVYYGHDTTKWIAIQARHTLQKAHSLLAVWCGKNLPIINRPFGQIETSFLSNPEFLSNNGTNIWNEVPSLSVSIMSRHTYITKRESFPSQNLGYHNHSFNWPAIDTVGRSITWKSSQPSVKHIRPQSVWVYATGDTYFLPNCMKFTEKSPLSTPCERYTFTPCIECFPLLIMGIPMDTITGQKPMALIT